MGLMFGYMDYLIFAKWATKYTDEKGDVPDNTLVPSIITTLIDMALKLGGVGTTNGPIISNQSNI